jgi:ligand-binding sensor domain-containing protein
MQSKRFNKLMSKLLVFLSALLVSVSAFSQQYNFISYSVEEGLAQSQIRAICQDDDGYIWVGTLGGLSKFDGIHFENFSTNDGLLNNQINSIFKDSRGNVWIGSRGGVTVYDGSEFKNYQFKKELSQNVVLSIAEDNSNQIWFATDGGGMVYMDDSRFNYVLLPNGADNNYIRSIDIDESDNIWLATRNGVSIIDTDRNIKDTISDINATQIFIDNDESVWCSTYGQGVLHLVEGECIKYKSEAGLISNHIRGFVKRKDGSFWFVSKFGISKYSKDGMKNFTEVDGLRNSNIKVVIEDDEGNLFLGSDGGGLVKFTNEDFISYTENDVIGSNVVMSVLEDFNRNIWVSTYGQGVGVFTSKGFVLLTTEDGLGNNTVWCSMVSKEKNLWVGTDFGVSVFDGVKFKTYGPKEGLNAKVVYAINDDSKNNVWIGTKEGVSVLNKLNDSITNLGIGKNVRDIFVENEKYIWFCSSDGLFKYDVETKKAKQYTEEDGLQSKSVMNIVKGKNDTYWIGTANGLSLLSKGKVSNVNIPGNFSANNINFLELDDFGNLWIGTNFGLYQLNVLNKGAFEATDFIRYSNLDGLKSLECNQNASYVDSKNNLWFGTSYGLMKHKLNPDGKSFSLPKVQIKDIRLFLEKKDLSKYSKGYDEVTNLPNDLSLKYNKNHLTFDFVGVYHTSPDKVKYRIKLDGFDEVWQPITQSTYVTYSNIPSGDFTFKLSATTDLKNWTRPINFSFTVERPFWLTWWFYLLCLFFITGVVWFVVKKKIEKDENRRSTQLIIDKSKMLELEQQALNSSMNRHFIFNALNSIQYYINRQDKIAANKYLSSFAKLVRKNLDSSLVNEIYLDDEIERISLYLKLEEMRFQDKFDYQINVDPMIESQSVKIPSMLLQPFIENSIWHGILPRDKKGNIKVDIHRQENKLIIKIVDDGIGIDISVKNKKGKNQHHDSKGMDLTKGRINLISKVSKKACAIKGPYQIYDKNKEIAGTEVSIILTL